MIICFSWYHNAYGSPLVYYEQHTSASSSMETSSLGIPSQLALYWSRSTISLDAPCALRQDRSAKPIVCMLLRDTSSNVFSGRCLRFVPWPFHPLVLTILMPIWWSSASNIQSRSSLDLAIAQEPFLKTLHFLIEASSWIEIDRPDFKIPYRWVWLMKPYSTVSIFTDAVLLQFLAKSWVYDTLWPCGVDSILTTFEQYKNVAFVCAVLLRKFEIWYH